MAKRERFTLPTIEDVRKEEDIRVHDRLLLFRNTTSTDSHLGGTNTGRDAERKTYSTEMGSSNRGPSPSSGTEPGTTLPGSSSDVNYSGVSTQLRPHAITVNPVQRNNPLMTYVKNVPWEVDDIVPDFILGRTTCALFLSCRYHVLKPHYIHERLRQLGKRFELRLLLVLVDSKDCQRVLSDLAKIAILSDLTLVLAWSSEEAAHYLEMYKAFEHKPPDALKEKLDSDLSSRAIECLSSVRKVNKTDASTLLSNLKTLEAIVSATPETLAMCPGIGSQKAGNLWKVFNEQFTKQN